MTLVLERQEHYAVFTMRVEQHVGLDDELAQLGQDAQQQCRGARCQGSPLG